MRVAYRIVRGALAVMAAGALLTIAAWHVLAFRIAAVDHAAVEATKARVKREQG